MLGGKVYQCRTSSVTSGDIPLVRWSDFRQRFFAFVFAGCFTLLIFVSFQQQKIFYLSILFLIYNLYSAFQLQTQEIDRLK